MSTAGMARLRGSLAFLILCTLMVTVLSGANSSIASERRLQFPGGYVTLPGPGVWKMIPSQAGQFATKLLAPDHSIVAVLQYEVAASNREAFVYLTQPSKVLEENIKAVQRFRFTDAGITLVSFTSKPSKWKGNECADYRADLEDRGQPGRALGRFCILKDRKGLFLSLVLLDYSERRPASAEPYAGFEQEATAFFDGLAVTR